VSPFIKHSCRFHDMSAARFRGYHPLVFGTLNGKRWIRSSCDRSRTIVTQSTLAAAFDSPRRARASLLMTTFAFLDGFRTPRSPARRAAAPDS
jgi:hypothetical protein